MLVKPSNPLIRALNLTLASLCFAILPNIVYADSLPERIDLFVSLFDYNSATTSYDIRSIQTDFPTRLLTPDSMLPQTSEYPLKDIQLLYRLSQGCTGKLPLSPLITEPLVFTRSLCKGSSLSPRRFARSGLIHPGGGTYAFRYAEKYPAQFANLLPYMHIQERPNAPEGSLLYHLQNMSEDSINALIAGASMFGSGNELWLRKGDIYYLFNEEAWLTNANKAGLSYSLFSTDNTCFIQRGNICWNVEDHSDLLRTSMIILVIANILLVLGWSGYRWNSKRQEMRSRMLILQILTHELRTPIASLSLTVEGFRREFEHLPESLYDEFRRLCEDSRRLRQLAEASKDYLQSDSKPLASDWVPSVEEWLQYKVEEEFSGNVALKLNQDVAAKLNVYWLGTCVDNLLRNAVKYGVAPVTLEVITQTNSVTFKVTDQGSLTHRDWRHLRKPFVSKSGLGLGLTIVESMVGRMGGKMSLEGPPTTFILEIPCETDTASR